MKTLYLATCVLLATPVAYAQQQLPAPAAEADSVARFQQRLNAEFRNPAQSPLTAEQRASFAGLPFYPVRYEYCVVARLVRDSTALPFAMPVSHGLPRQYRRYGELRFTLHGQPQRLTVYQSLDLLKRPEYVDYLLLPFTDATTGHGSYGGGRYLDLRIPPADMLVLDFNKAYNPSCAYSANYSCPVPPAENRLAVSVEAGIRSGQ